MTSCYQSFGHAWIEKKAQMLQMLDDYVMSEVVRWLEKANFSAEQKDLLREWRNLWMEKALIDYVRGCLNKCIFYGTRVDMGSDPTCF